MWGTIKVPTHTHADTNGTERTQTDYDASENLWENDRLDVVLAPHDIFSGVCAGRGSPALRVLEAPRTGPRWSYGPVPGLILLVAVVAFYGGREAHRRSASRASVSAEEVLSQSRLEAQRVLSRAEEEARAMAEAYREREDATLEYRRLESSALEGSFGAA